MLTLAEKIVFDKLISNNKIKNTTKNTLAVTSGLLYSFVAIEGGENLKKILNLNESNADQTIYAMGAGAGLVNVMFTLKTLEALDLKIDTRMKIAFSILAPFSAAPFLTACRAGALSVGIHSSLAMTMGVLLSLIRIINCVDASVKFPARLIETKTAWDVAYQKRDHAEIARLIVVWFGGIGYAAATTDATYNSTEIICKFLTINPDATEVISYITSILGAFGTLPLIVYWCHRGLRQLTFGGEVKADGTTPDPTDIYTYLGFILVTPVILGVLGGATISSGSVFAQLGTFATVIRVSSSVLYASFSGTPGMATLLRDISKFIKKSTTQSAVVVNDEENPSPLNCWHRFCGKNNGQPSELSTSRTGLLSKKESRSCIIS